MTPADKQKLKDAFTKAVNDSPYADEKINGIVMSDGTPATRRKLIEAAVDSEQFYQAVDQAVGTGKITIDQIIEKFEHDVKQPPRAPRP